ncbi:MAG TPA: glycosyltransferase family 4 protein [Gemmatimonadaceae bacterium]
MAERRRVLFVVNDPRFFLTHRLALALGVREAGYDVHVATPEEPASRELRQAGLPYHPVPLQRQGTNPLADVATIGGLARLYRAVRPDLVHQVTVKPVLYGTIAARIARVPAVVNAIAGLGQLFAGGGAAARARRAMLVQGYRLALGHPNARTIFQTEDDRARFIELGLVRAERTALIRGSGADLDAIVPLPEPPGDPVVVLVARLLRQKGIAEFAAAARQLRTEGVAARFALVGDQANNRDAVPQEQLQRWRDEGTLELWGWRTDMGAVFGESAIACLPTYYPEGVPKALIDAAAAGRPIVASETPGCRAVVQPGENGLLVPPRDPGALADALRRLLADRALRARYGAAGRRIAEERFSVRAVVRETLGVYEAALSART